MKISAAVPLALLAGFLSACTSSQVAMEAPAPGPSAGMGAIVVGPSAGSPQSVALRNAVLPSEPARARQEADPRLRPGLGTAAGEITQSTVNVVASERISPQQPNGTASIHYDNRDGIIAQAGVPANYFDNRTMPIVINETGQTCTMNVSLRGGWGRIYPASPRYARDGRYYVMGDPGSTYTINVENANCRYTYEAVTTVDGMDVLTGQPGSMRNRGYLIEPGKTLRIEGFRLGNDRVATFKFDSVANSYAARPGSSARNVGVIGIAFFAQRPTAETVRRTTADPFPADQRRR